LEPLSGRKVQAALAEHDAAQLLFGERVVATPPCGVDQRILIPKTPGVMQQMAQAQASRRRHHLGQVVCDLIVQRQLAVLGQ
jgi:hypothetical protein